MGGSSLSMDYNSYGEGKSTKFRDERQLVHKLSVSESGDLDTFELIIAI